MPRPSPHNTSPGLRAVKSWALIYELPTTVFEVRIVRLAQPHYTNTKNRVSSCSHNGSRRNDLVSIRKRSRSCLSHHTQKCFILFMQCVQIVFRPALVVSPNRCWKYDALTWFEAVFGCHRACPSHLQQNWHRFSRQVGYLYFCRQKQRCDAFEAVLLFSNFNKIFCGYVDPENVFLDNRNNSFSGWPNRYFS